MYISIIISVRVHMYNCYDMYCIVYVYACTTIDLRIYIGRFTLKKLYLVKMTL